MAELLYVDTSALLDRVLRQKRHKAVEAVMHAHGSRGGLFVSSRLLHLEVRRVEVRERLAGGDLGFLGELAAQIAALPVTDEVWSAAYGIEQHARTLDALHLATCELVGATLLSTDDSMVELAPVLGIEVAQL